MSDPITPQPAPDEQCAYCFHNAAMHTNPSTMMFLRRHRTELQEANDRAERYRSALLAIVNIKHESHLIARHMKEIAGKAREK